MRSVLLDNGDTVLRLDEADKSLSCLQVVSRQRGWYRARGLKGFISTTSTSVETEILAEAQHEGEVVDTPGASHLLALAHRVAGTSAADDPMTLSAEIRKIKGRAADFSLSVKATPLLLLVGADGSSPQVLTLTVDISASPETTTEIRYAVRVTDLPPGYSCATEEAKWVNKEGGRRLHFEIRTPEISGAAYSGAQSCTVQILTPNAATRTVVGAVAVPIVAAVQLASPAAKPFQFGPKSRPFTFKLDTARDASIYGLPPGWLSAPVAPALNLLRGLPIRTSFTVFFLSSDLPPPPPPPPGPENALPTTAAPPPTAPREELEPVAARAAAKAEAVQVPEIAPPVTAAAAGAREAEESEQDQLIAGGEAAAALAMVEESDESPPVGDAESGEIGLGLEDVSLADIDLAAQMAEAVVKPAPALRPNPEDKSGQQEAVAAAEAEVEEEKPGPSTSDSGSSERRKGRAGAPAKEKKPFTHDGFRVLMPVSIVTYNVLSVGSGEDGKVRSAAARDALNIPFTRLAPLRSINGKQALDIVCIQELKGKEGREELFKSMTRAGYDYVTAGEHAIFWQRATFSRVRSESTTEPDYVWSLERNGEDLLSACWGSSDYGADHFTQQRFREMRAKMLETKGESKTFFRYPPITVILRRTWPATSTHFVVTSVHTPGSNTSYERSQLEREVLWLLGTGSYKAVMNHLAARDPALKQLTKRRRDASGKWVNEPSYLFDANASTRYDCIHLVIGDLNTHLYSTDLKERYPRRNPLQDKVRGWHAEHGSAETLDVPSTAHNFPDAAYLWRKGFAPERLYIASSSVDLQRMEGGKKYGPSDHKPLFVDLSEGVPEAYVDVGGPEAYDTGSTMRVFSELPLRIAQERARLEAEGINPLLALRSLKLQLDAMVAAMERAVGEPAAAEDPVPGTGTEPESEAQLQGRGEAQCQV